jgi:hypothetical protein
MRGPDSSVGTATGYGLDGPEIESRWRRDFPHVSRPALGPTHPPVQLGTGSFSEVKNGRGVTLTPHPLLVPGHKSVELYLYSPYGPTACTEPQCLYKRALYHFSYMEAEYIVFAICTTELTWIRGSV